MNRLDDEGGDGPPEQGRAEPAHGGLNWLVRKYCVTIRKHCAASER